MTDDEAIRANCKKFREEAGISQQDAANAMRVSVDALRNWEQGRRTPDRNSLIALSRLYGRPVEDFFNPKPPALTSAPPRAEFEFRLKNLQGGTPAELEADVEALRRKWTPERLAEHARAKADLKKGKKK